MTHSGVNYAPLSCFVFVTAPILPWMPTLASCTLFSRDMAELADAGSCQETE
jgi:hypothetical protein